MRVGADHRVEVGNAVELEDHAREVLKVHLVADPHARRYDAELLERALGPLQEGVSLDVALVLNGDVLLETGVGARLFENHRVVNDEFDRDQGIDLFGVPTQGDDRVTHRCKVDDCGNASEVLHQDARGGEGNLLGVVTGCFSVSCRGLSPTSQSLDVRGPHLHTVFVPKKILEQRLDRIGESFNPELTEGSSLQ